MGAKIWVPLVLSVVLGLGAALVAGRMLSAPHGNKSGGAVTVVVAAHDVDAGTELSPADLTTLKYPPKEVPAGAFTDPNQLAHRVTVAPLLKGQLAMETLLAPAGMPPGLESLVPPGMRAVTLEVNEFSGLAGMICPGEQVDVIANLRDEATRETSSRTIVQDIRVLAVGRALGKAVGANGAPAPASNSVTLLVTPKQAQTIQLASQSCRPWLALRGFHDQKQIDPGSTSMAELRGDSDDLPAAPKLFETSTPAPVPAPATQPAAPVASAAKPVDPPPQRTVRLILGTEEQRLSFRADSEPDASQVTTLDKGPAVPQ